MSDRSYIVLRSDFQSFSKVAGNYKELRSGGQSSACQEIANYFKIANKFNNYLHSALSLEAYILLQAANLVISMGDLSCSQGVFDAFLISVLKISRDPTAFLVPLLADMLNRPGSAHKFYSVNPQHLANFQQKEK